MMILLLGFAVVTMVFFRSTFLSTPPPSAMDRVMARIIGCLSNDFLLEFLLSDSKNFSSESNRANSVDSSRGSVVDALPPGAMLSVLLFAYLLVLHPVCCIAVLQQGGDPAAAAVVLACVACAYPGSMADSRIMQLSPLWGRLPSLLGRYGFCLYGDAAYPLLPFLLTGYRNRAKLPSKKLKFNNHGSRARVIIECSFGKLKSQWKCLDGGLRTEGKKNWSNTIAACCILHNVTILVDGAGWKMNDPFNGGRVPRAAGGGVGVAVGGTSPNNTDPDAALRAAPRSHIRDNARAEQWRERLFHSLMKKIGEE